MKKVELNIIAMANSDSSPGNFTLVLEERIGFRRLPIIIGAFEAQAIAVSLEKMKPTRPLTHDLFKNTLELLGAELAEVIISGLVEGVFHALLIGKKADGTPLQVDARSSDAIALAVRFGCPIFTYEAIMQEASVVLDRPSKAFTNKRGRFADYSLEELQQLLAQVLEKEDYESATKIRDAMKGKENS
ncbi:MAG: bifunctional nuclease family protein [Bacteroidota bacterium]